MNPLNILFSGLLISTACQGHSVVINRCCSPPLVYDETLDQCVNNELDQASVPSAGTELLQVPYSCVSRLDGNNETEFRLQNELPVTTCTKGNHIQTLTIPSNGSKCSSTRLTSRGQLRVAGNNNEVEYYSPNEFCVIGSDEIEIKFRVCNATCTKEAPCIRKCCGISSILDLKGGVQSPVCVRSNDHYWKPRFYSSPTNPIPLAENDRIQPHYTYTHPTYFCSGHETAHFIEEQRDSRTGKLYWKFRLGLDRNFYHRKSRYDWDENSEYWKYSCADGAINSKHHSKDHPDVFDGNEEEDVMVFCIPNNATLHENHWRPTVLYVTAMTLSCVCLLVTLVVYGLLWNSQNLHGWTLMSYCASLFLMYFFFIFKYILVETTYQGDAPDLCVFIGVAVNFFFVSTFCWLTMINFDLWSEFRVLPIQPKSARGLSHYLVYVGISTAIPLTIVTVGLILDAVHGSEPESGVIIPEYGVHQCGLGSTYAHWIFQNGPAGVFLLLNLVFFTSTVYSIFTEQSESKMTRPAGSQTERVKLFAKILVVMGISYIFEFVSNLVGGENTHEGWLWETFAVINSSQGVFIFIIFVFKRDVLRSLGEKYASFRRFMQGASMETGTMNPETSSRTHQINDSQL